MIFKTPSGIPQAIREEPTSAQIEAWCAVLWHWQKIYHPIATPAQPAAGLFNGWYQRARTLARDKKVHQSAAILQFHIKLPHDIVTASFALIFPDSEDYIPH